jgi:microcystin-dependent protein
MPYTVNFTDKNNKTPITVFDNTSSTDTSLTFPGRNVTGYGQIIAENFLHLLENFSSATAPVAPTEGQLWYDTSTGTMQLWDGTSWKAASNIQKGPTTPDVETSKIGELWVDTTNQQLRIFTGTRWILVGPNESSIDGLRYGPAVERIADSDNNLKNILSFYVADVPVIVVSKDSFTPKISITGFANGIKAGVNITSPLNDTEALTFGGGFLPKLYGTATSADSLNVANVAISAGKFLRSDIINTTDYAFNVRSNSGITLGVDGTFTISNTANSATIYNSQAGSSLNLQTNKNGIPNTVLSIRDTNVGINIVTPAEALDVDGNIGLTGSLIISNTTDSSNFGNGSIRTAGGAAISKSLLVGNNLSVAGTTQVAIVQPSVTDIYDNGTATKRWKTIRAKTVVADEIQGVLSGSITGNAGTATSLKTATVFKLDGDVISPNVTFDGQVGGQVKTFATQLTANIIASKNEPSPNVSKLEDLVLTYRPSLAGIGGNSGLLKQTRNTFIGDLGVPIGGIMPFAGSTAPYGYLLCDGSEVEIVKYQLLYDVIGATYNGSTALVGIGTFRLPDLRGRFALGRDNMDNAQTVPNVDGGFTDAGGGTASRVPDIKAQSIGGGAGQSSVKLSLANLPDHEHSLAVNGIQYSAVRVDTAINSPGVTGLGPTAPGQAQYLNESGGVKLPAADFQLNEAVGIMNPYLTVNYIIRSGPPAFTTTTG